MVFIRFCAMFKDDHILSSSKLIVDDVLFEVECKMNRAQTCPILLLPRSSHLTAPTRNDERPGSWAAYGTLAAQPQRFSRTPGREERWGREVKWAWRRINGVSPLLLPRELILMDLHHLYWFIQGFHNHNTLKNLVSLFNLFVLWSLEFLRFDGEHSLIYFCLGQNCHFSKYRSGQHLHHGLPKQK